MYEDFIYNFSYPLLLKSALNEVSFSLPTEHMNHLFRLYFRKVSLISESTFSTTSGDLSVQQEQDEELLMEV